VQVPRAHGRDEVGVAVRVQRDGARLARRPAQDGQELLDARLVLVNRHMDPLEAGLLVRGEVVPRRHA
jgi:hypothetical protein